MTRVLIRLDGRDLTVQLLPAHGASLTASTTFQYDYGRNEQTLIAWYFDDYLRYSYDVFRQRAASAERRLREVGERLFEAVFGRPDCRKMYSAVASRLDCRLLRWLKE